MAAVCLGYMGAYAQSFQWISSTEQAAWKQQKSVSLKGAAGAVDVSVPKESTGRPFVAWGVTFNELDWDALSMLTRDEQDEILQRVFSPQGELRIERGRVSMGANDYARSWYSCDEVPGDLELRYFNIDRDKQTIIPFIRAAQKYNPYLVCWVSPWSPPSWMKVNHNYAVLSSDLNELPEKMNYLLYGKTGGRTDANEMQFEGERNGLFPKKLATTDYFIQDPRYLYAYAESFCKFIDAYREQGVKIDMVMYQNEAYSYTPYPGCAWTAEATVRFNKEYLGPMLRDRHPEVKLYLGTLNTNRLDHVLSILQDDSLRAQLVGVGLQWEGRQILPTLHEKFPELRFVSSESECGWGSFDWRSAEHTFELINHYLGNGCDEYNFWNLILTDKGVSTWGWKQNALIRVDSKTRRFTYTPEYYAARHYCEFIDRGALPLAYKGEGDDKKPILVYRDSKGKYVVVAGNFLDTPQTLKVGIRGKVLQATLPPHSLNTFTGK